MDIHENARTTRHSRMLMIERLHARLVDRHHRCGPGVTGKAVRKWRDRHVAEGARGLVDRSSRPHRSPARLGRPEEEQPSLCAASV